MPTGPADAPVETLSVTTSNLRLARLARLQGGILLMLVALVGCGGGDKPPAPPVNPLLPPGVLHQDDFEQADDKWDLYDDGIVSYLFQEGRLVVTVNDINASAWSSLSFTFDDFALEVEAIKLDGPDDNGFGVLFRYQDADNYYRFDISSDGYYALSTNVEGTFEAVSEWHASDAILAGAQTNRLRVVGQGNTFSFAVNDTPLRLCIGPQAIWDPANLDTCLGGQVLDTWTDGTFPSGQIALGVTAFHESGPSISFDNLVIRKPEATP